MHTLLLLAVTALPAPHGIRVVDDGTGRPVPLVELRTVHEQLFVTDNAGWVAVGSPELLGRRVYFHVRSHGYEHAKDGFGYRGTALDLRPGGRSELKIRRLNLAERLCRLTGAGQWAESELLGEPVPVREDAGVFGQDSVETEVYRGRLFWFWGDTNRASYPLGNFQTTGATSDLPADPEAGVALRYFRDGQGFVKAMAPVPGDGPTWIGGLVALRDAAGEESLWCTWAKVRGMLTVYRRGLARWSDAAERFEPVATWAEGAPVYPHGHPVVHGDHVYFAQPWPLLRVATRDGLARLDAYEGYTCLRPDGSVGEWSWRRGAAPMDQKTEAALLKAGKLKPEDARLQMRDLDGGKPVQAHGGSVYHNPWRGRWVAIFAESGGASSHLGEIWYAEAPDLTGPWQRARKVLTHDKYSFYNPKQHPYFARDGGRVIYFEGTYTAMFSRQGDATPRYDYNQMLYRLDLAEASRRMGG